MSDPDVIADRERYAAVGREYSELEPAHALAREWRTLNDDLEGARELLAEDEDEELRRVVAEAPARLEELAEGIRLAMVERDPNDDKNVLVEIRAGAGGDEAALFAGDLYKMLTRYAEERGFATEVLSQSAAEVGGFKDVTFAIKGDGAYSVFKYEGGTHRVQRVPKTESQGRIHTSTATVAVLPEAEEVDVADRPQRPPDRRLPLLGPRRAVGQHDRLGGPDHPQAERDRRLDAGREVAAPEPRQGDAGAAGAAAREGDRRPAGRDLGRAPLPGRDRRALGEGPHLQLPPGPRHRPPDQAHQPRARGGPRRRPARVQRGARGRGEAPQARGAGRAAADRGRPTAAGTVGEALGAASDALDAAGVDSPRLDAELLLAEATGPGAGGAGGRPGGAASTPPPARRVRRDGPPARRAASRSPTSSAAGASGGSSCAATAGR